jgi:hypothetical protein
MFDDNCPFSTAALEALLDALLRFEQMQAEQALEEMKQVEPQVETGKE